MNKMDRTLQTISNKHFDFDVMRQKGPKPEPHFSTLAHNSVKAALRAAYRAGQRSVEKG
jgi:hypothetical protein